ncbi:hypothetical protein GCM10023075_49960 [Streptosporangium album]
MSVDLERVSLDLDGRESVSAKFERLEKRLVRGLGRALSARQARGAPARIGGTELTADYSTPP